MRIEMLDTFDSSIVVCATCLRYRDLQPGILNAFSPVILNSFILEDDEWWDRAGRGADRLDNGNPVAATRLQSFGVELRPWNQDGRLVCNRFHESLLVHIVDFVVGNPIGSFVAWKSWNHFS